MREGAYGVFLAHSLTSFVATRQPKICNLDLAALEQEVVGLEVAVHDTFRMQVCETMRCPFKDEARLNPILRLKQS
eukprot:CAMPEP_0174713396 /NCGR_PEP_ID=MMETSP1094-20130205/14079_1 /TAXON_ID=156173 /ORGANISM="Chrysochromulina brevifilum, Strain UTEX LB 985" /LENGTH=75 /DNA_ID=CAMNT_0015912573 /DNA_START=613 /DNA_END=840 /DNA_ORIENTATION=-